MPIPNIKMDASLAKNLVLAPLLHHKGQIDKLAAALKQAGPSAPLLLAHALTQDFLHAKKALIKNKVPIAPQAWSAPGGAFDLVIKEVCELLAAKLGQTVMSSGFMVATKKALLQGLHADHQASKGPPQTAPAVDQGPPPGMAPNTPQGAPMPNMGGM